MKRISVNITDEQYAALDTAQKRVGVPVSVQVRKALEKAAILNVVTPAAMCPYCHIGAISKSAAIEIAAKLNMPFEELYERIPVLPEEEKAAV